MEKSKSINRYVHKEEISMKTCSKCHTEKPLTDFRFIRKNKNGTDLYRAKCNDCYNGHYIEKYRQKDYTERKEIYKENNWLK